MKGYFGSRRTWWFTPSRQVGNIVGLESSRVLCIGRGNDASAKKAAVPTTERKGIQGDAHPVTSGARANSGQRPSVFHQTMLQRTHTCAYLPSSSHQRTTTRFFSFSSRFFFSLTLETKPFSLLTQSSKTASILFFFGSQLSFFFFFQNSCHEITNSSSSSKNKRNMFNVLQMLNQV